MKRVVREFMVFTANTRCQTVIIVIIAGIGAGDLTRLVFWCGRATGGVAMVCLLAARLMHDVDEHQAYRFSACAVGQVRLESKTHK